MVYVEEHSSKTPLGLKRVFTKMDVPRSAFVGWVERSETQQVAGDVATQNRRKSAQSV